MPYRPYLFVAGSHRGGTSLTCQVLQALGMDFGGPLAGPGPANPHGFVEHLHMRSQVIKPWLAKIGADRMGQHPLPPRDWRPTPEQAAAFRAEVTAKLDGAQAHKDAKTLALWPLFHAAFPDARWLVVRREPEAIARSCVRTSFMVRFSTLDQWREWARDQHARMDDLVAATNAVEVWPDPTDAESFRAAMNALGLTWDRPAVDRVLHPESWGGGEVPAANPPNPRTRTVRAGQRELHVTIERDPPAPVTRRTIDIRTRQIQRARFRASGVRTVTGRPATDVQPSRHTQADSCLILGGANTVWRDVAVLETLIDGYWPGVVIAVNDIGVIWPRRLDHWASVHPEKMSTTVGWKNPRGGRHGWAGLRESKGLPSEPDIWSNAHGRHHGKIDRVLQQWASGSSGLFAVAVAYKLGMQRVVLAGTPMDDRGHFTESLVHHPDQAWTSVRSHRKAWETHLPRLRERTRSLSGWTREVLGFPDLGWLCGDVQRERVA